MTADSEIPGVTKSQASPVLLSGASGMLGQALRRSLEAEGQPVLQLVRRPSGAQSELQWDPNATQPVRDAGLFEGLRAAIHLSGANVAAHRWTSSYRREIVSSRVASTHALASLLAELRRPPEVLLVASATGIYGDRGSEVLNETSDAGKGFLAEVCQMWEEAALPAVKAGIRVVHLRFGVVLGAGSGALGRMIPLFRFGLGGRLGSGRQWMSWISLADAVAAMRFLMEQPDMAGAVNLTSPHPVTNAEFTKALGRALHRPSVLHAPAFGLRLALGQMADEALLASARVLPARLHQAGYRFRYPHLSEALAAIVS